MILWIRTSYQTAHPRLRACATVGFYSIGLYPGSLAYNAVMQAGGTPLLLAPRPGRELLGAFAEDALQGMDPDHVVNLHRMARHEEGHETVPNTLEIPH